LRRSLQALGHLLDALHDLGLAVLGAMMGELEPWDAIPVHGFLGGEVAFERFLVLREARYRFRQATFASFSRVPGCVQKENWRAPDLVHWLQLGQRLVVGSAQQLDLRALEGAAFARR
jgi:hypothetical protein